MFEEKYLRQLMDIAAQQPAQTLPEYLHALYQAAARQGNTQQYQGEQGSSATVRSFLRALPLPRLARFHIDSTTGNADAAIYKPNFIPPLSREQTRHTRDQR